MLLSVFSGTLLLANVSTVHKEERDEDLFQSVGHKVHSPSFTSCDWQPLHVSFYETWVSCWRLAVSWGYRSNQSYRSNRSHRISNY